MGKQIEQKIKATEGARNFGALIQEVTSNKNKYIVERNGDPVAALVPIEVYEQWKRERKAFFQKIQEISEKSNLSENEAKSITGEALKSVRNNEQT